jgi:hypothetical protein
MHSRLNIPAPARVKAANDAWKTSTRQSNAELSLRAKRISGFCAEKSFSCSPDRPYRKPTQVGECKRTQARERNLSKELGTLAP